LNQNCREEYADHTCDKRRTRSYIEETFPDYVIEDGLTEQDELYTGTIEGGETKQDVVRRANGVLNRMFTEDTDASCESILPIPHQYAAYSNVGSHLDNGTQRNYQRILGYIGLRTIFTTYRR
jgi:hypothetical protein